MLSFFAAGYVEAGAACTPFRVHLSAALPAAPNLEVPAFLPANWEKIIPEKISARSTQKDFARHYKTWLSRFPTRLSDNERWQWLTCLDYYTSLDTNKNGIPDWSAISDEMPATNLFPQDPDQDGDGILNVYDAEPLQKSVNPPTDASGIPAHLRITRAETSDLQVKIFREFGILAIDHTDQHSPEVLTEILFLLRKGFSKEFMKSLNLKYIYAFASHDPYGTKAAYHWQAQAMSVAGLRAYHSELSAEARVDLLSSLSHELGHAVLFDKLSTSQLAEVSTSFSGWQPIEKTEIKDAFFSPVFFQALPSNTGRNIVSEYAMKNRHEWFAESFAASMLNNLGASGTLGKNWRQSLRKPTFAGGTYWVDYTRITDDFRQWFGALLKNR